VEMVISEAGEPISAVRSLRTLEWLVAPTEVKEFMRDYWTRRPLHVQRDTLYYKDIFEADDFASAIAQMPGSVGMGTYDKGFNNTAEKYDTLCGAFVDGGGIVINGFQQGWRALSRLCAELQGIFYSAVMNLYLTPRQAQTFTTHTDAQDVFILQISGHKNWELFEGPVAAPFEEQQIGKKGSAALQLGPPTLSTVLRPGDLLYIPRGTPHHCTTDTEASLHLTLTMSTSDWAWGTFLDGALQRMLLQTPGLRKAVPPGVLHLPSDAPELKALEAEFATVSKAALEDMAYQDGLRHLQDHVQLRADQKGDELDRLSRPPAANIRRSSEVQRLAASVEMHDLDNRPAQNRRIAVTTFQRTLPMRALMQDAVQFIEASKPGTRFTVGSIPHADSFEQICLAEMMSAMGIIDVTKG